MTAGHRVFRVDERASGLLLHPTSLPSPYPVGDIGPAAYQFVDQLAAAGQRWWQMLPVCPPGAGHAPYNTDSSFAATELLISPERLVERGLLPIDEAARHQSDPSARVRYEAAYECKRKLLQQAFVRFKERGGTQSEPWQRYQHSQASWLEPHCLYRAIKFQVMEGKPWHHWPAPLRDREPAALERIRQEHADAMAFEQFIQFQFHEQWSDLRAYAHRLNVALMGDLPIYVSHDSADVWAHRELFDLDEHGKPREVSGAPPDCFSADGQMWGHPLYCWPAHEAQKFTWWVSRISNVLSRFDAVRIDHFLGLTRYWRIPAQDHNARRGSWGYAPGEALFAAIAAALPDAQLVVEDLGCASEDAHVLRDRFKLPGMRLLHEGLLHGGEYHLPHHHPRSSVVYTGTHDNEPVQGWFAKRTPQEKERVLKFVRTSPRFVHMGLIRMAMGSVSNLTIIPVQDVLGLGSSSRMNLPGTPDGNWRWRLRPGAIRPHHLSKLRELCEMYERVPKL